MGAWVGVHEVLTAAGEEEEAYFRRFARETSDAPPVSLMCGYDRCHRTFGTQRGLHTHVTMMHRRKK